MKRTPGPWRIDDKAAILCILAPKSSVAVVSTGWADARLIAAAPELLAACEKMLRYLVELAESTDMLPQSWPMVAEAQATIKNAKGEDI